MKRALTLALFALLAISATAQHKNDDSLERAIPLAKSDTLKARILALICSNNIDEDDAKVSIFARRLLVFAEKIKDPIGLCDANNCLGIVADNRSDYDSALYFYRKALEAAAQTKHPRRKASIANNIGLIYWRIGDYQKSLEMYFDALKVFEQLNDKKYQANALSNIGLTYNYMADYKKALEYQRKALALRVQIKDDYGMASTYTNLSKVYANIKHHDSSLFYNLKAMELQEKNNDNYGLSITYLNLGTSYTLLAQYEKALEYLHKSENIRLKTGDKQGLGYCYSSIGDVYIRLKEYKKAIDYEQKALAIAQEINSKESWFKAAYILSEAYAGAGDYKNAHKYLMTYTNLRQEVYDKDRNKQAAELSVKYEVEKKDLVLKKNQAELQTQALKISRSKTQMALLLMLLVGTGGGSYLLYNRYRLRQEARLQRELIRQQDMASKAIIEAEERERKRIAGDLHDGVGQIVSAVKMNLSGLTPAIKFADAESEQVFDKTMALVDESCKEIRSISHQMMPNVLLKFGLSSAVRDFLDKIDERRIKVHLETSGISDRLDSNVEIVLYRIIQETVNNVIKHANASTLHIQIDKEDDGVNVTIEDNGKGFDSTAVDGYDGIGLKNMKSRVEFLKGTIEFDSAPGRGTVVSVWVPLL